MTAITTAPNVSWAAAHRAMLFVIGTLLAIAAAVAVAFLLMAGTDAPAAPTVNTPQAPVVDEPGCNVVRGPC